MIRHFRRDGVRYPSPDESGVFHGGPPLLGLAETIRLIEHSDEVEAEARKALRVIRDRQRRGKQEPKAKPSTPK